MLRLKKLVFREKRRWIAGSMAVLIFASVSVLLLPSHVEAAVQTKVGSFTVPASTGNNAVTGVGFQPKAILLFSNTRAGDGSSSNGGQNAEAVMTILGMATSSSARAAIYTTDDFTCGNPAYIATQVLRSQQCNGGGQNIFFAADFVSMDADGFTVNFTTANATAYVVNYMALGGTDLTAGIKSFTSPGSTGNQSQTGLGFKPDAMILVGGIVGPSQISSRGLGFISGTSNQVANSSNYGGGGGGDNTRYQRTDKAYVQTNGTSKINEATLTSFDNDGFTLNYTTATSGSSLSALALKGIQLRAGSFTQKTSTGTQATTGVGFQPVGLLTSTVAGTASTSIVTSAQIVQAIGASDGTNHATVNSSGWAVGNTTLDRTKIYKAIADNGTPTVQAAAALSSFDVDGFTLNYTTADATAREIIYLAFGPTSNTTSAAPTLSTPAASATGVSVLPQFQLRTTDPDNDYLRYKIELCSISDCSSIIRTIDQTSSQTGWNGQDQQTSTAYTGNSSIGSSTMAVHNYQSPALNPNTQYWWRAYAIDPGGVNTFSSASSIQSFTTAINFPTNTNVLDNFNRADTTAIGGSITSSGYIWGTTLLQNGNTPTLGIQTNLMYLTASNNNTYINSSFGPDVEEHVDVTTAPLNTQTISLYARIQTPGSAAFDCYALIYTHATAGNATWQLGRYTNGALTSISSVAAPAIAAGDSIGFDVTGIGDTVALSAYRKTSGAWTTISSATDTNVNRIVTAGFLGVEIENNTSRLDNLSGGDMSSVEIRGGTTINGGTLIQ